MADQDDQIVNPEQQAEQAEQAEQEEREPLTVTVEDSGPARKLLKIQVPAERIAAKLEENFGRLREEAVVPGFRRGRAPRRLIEKRFGESIRDDVKANLLSEAYTQAVEEQKLDVLGEPDVKDIEKIELPEEGSLSFEVEVEVTPDVTLPDFAAIEVEKPIVEVTDEQVQKEIDEQARRFGNVKEVPGASVEPEDYLQGAVKVLAGENPGDDAEVLMDLPQAYIYSPGEVTGGRGQIAGLLIHDLADQLKGKKVGDELRISMTGPSSHENEKIKDQPITIVAQIARVERIEPLTLDKLAEMMGVEDEAQLRTSLREHLEQRAQREQESAMHQQVSEYLQEHVDLTLPEGITGRQTARVLQRQAMELAYRGVSQEEIEQQIAESRASSEEEARRQLKLFFVLDKAARELDVEVSESEVNGRIAMMALQQGRRPEKLRQEMQRNNEIESLYLSIREHKTLTAIIEKASVKEVESLSSDAKDDAEQAEDQA